MAHYVPDLEAWCTCALVLLRVCMCSYVCV